MHVLTEVKSHLQTARALEEQGAFEEAVSIYKQASRCDPGSWPACAGIWRRLYQQGRLGEAEKVIRDYLNMLEVAPGAALNDLGLIHAEQGQATDAIESFIQALRAPSPAATSVALGNLAYVLFTENRLDDCANACNNALRFDPNETRAHYTISVVESLRNESRQRSASKIAQEGTALKVFRPLRFSDQKMTKYRARIGREEEGQVHLSEDAPATRPGMPWGILASWRDELWCAFSKQSEGAEERSPSMQPMIVLPDEFRLVQRRCWVRIPTTDAIVRIDIRSLPADVAPFEVVKLFELNLSAGGAAVRSQPELPRGAEITLHLKLGNNEEIQVPARVVRIGQPLVAEAYSALDFDIHDEKMHERIAHFVHETQLRRKRSGVQVEAGPGDGLPDQ